MGEQSERAFDVVVWGATGFTGQLAAEELTHRYGTDGKTLKWAIAGRNQKKLEGVREALCAIDPAASQLTIFTGDSKDKASLKKIASQTKVVCTTVGPYAKYGSDLVEACIEEGTDYCDLTGEPHWIRKMIDENHDKAAAAKVRIVHCCGYDSIPSDLGALMLADAMKEQHGTPPDFIKMYTGKTYGGFSGGTIASMINIFEEASKDKTIRRTMVAPYSLLPEGAPKGPDGRDQMGMKYDKDLKMWTSPFIMASINTKIVRRSNALLDFHYGKDFGYSEVTGSPKGFKGWWMSAMMTYGMGVFGALVAFKPTRSLLQKTVLPAPGQGPSKETREKGYFNTHMLAKAGDKSLYALVHGPKDPGYGATAIMLSEAAVCLAKDREHFAPRYGILTPASSMGQTLIERLRGAGLIFEVSSSHIRARG